jgi:hypothetical protein
LILALGVSPFFAFFPLFFPHPPTPRQRYIIPSPSPIKLRKNPFELSSVVFFPRAEFFQQKQDEKNKKNTPFFSSAKRRETATTTTILPPPVCLRSSPFPLCCRSLCAQRGGGVDRGRGHEIRVTERASESEKTKSVERVGKRARAREEVSLPAVCAPFSPSGIFRGSETNSGSAARFLSFLVLEKLLK